MTYRWVRRPLRWLGRAVLALLVLVVVVSLLLLVPSMQNWLAGRLAATATERLGAEVRVGRVALRPFGPLVLEEVYIGDLRGDTLFAVGALRIAGLRVHPGRRLVQASSVGLERIRFALATAEGDAHSNLTNLLAVLGPSDTTTAGEDWTIRCGFFLVDGLHFSFHDGNVERVPFGVDFKHVDVRDARLRGHHLLVEGDSVAVHLEGLSLREHSGLVLEQLSGASGLSPRGITVEGLVLRTDHSDLRGDLRFTTESFADYDEFTELVNMRLDLDSSRIDFADIAFFAHDLEGIRLPIDMRGRVRGTVADLKGRGLSVSFGERSLFSGSADLIGLPDVANTFILLDIEELRTDHLDLAALPVPPFTTGGRLTLPKEVLQLGEMRFSGNFTGFTRAFTAYGSASTNLGTLRTDLSYERDTVSRVFSLSGRVASESFRPGPLLGAKALGPMAANIRIKGSGRTLAGMRADLEGSFPLITVSGTRLTGITAKGRLEPKLFNGELKADDEHLVLDFKGLADFRGEWPLVDFRANVQHADLAALGIAPVDGYNTLSVLVDARGRLSPDSLQGRMEFQDISWCDENGEHDLGDILLTSGRRGGENVLGLTATFADAEVTGTFLPTRLPGALASVVFSVFPVLRNEVDHAQAGQRFRFTATAKETGPLLDLFMPGLQLDSGALFSGWLDSRRSGIGLTADLPGFRWGNLRASDVRIMADKTLDVLAFKVESDRQTWKDSVWFSGTSLTGKAYQDELVFAMGWDDSNSGTNGRLDIEGEVRGPRSFDLDLLPSHLYFGRGNWMTDRPVRFTIDSSTVRVDSLTLINDDQLITLDGTISRDTSDFLAFGLQRVRLENLSPFMEGPELKGALNGTGSLYDLYASPHLLSDLVLDSLTVGDIRMGDLHFEASWAGGQRAIGLNGTLMRGAIKALAFEGSLSLEKEHGLDLDLVMDRFDLAFLEPYLPEALGDIHGLVTGQLTVDGSLTDPQVNGELDLLNAGLRVTYLNTLYSFSHRVRVFPDMIALDMATVRDEEGNTGRLGATVIHKGFADWDYHIWGTVDGLQVLNTGLKDNDLYHGKAYATGQVSLSGYGDNLEVTVDARTAPGTDIRFPIGGSTEVSPIGFVRFAAGDSLPGDEPTLDLSGVTLDLKVEVTPDARFELVFDPTVGDILSGRGRGNIEMEVGSTGAFAMRGQVQVTEGDYLFTLRNVVNKRFQIVPGGRITWFGDPFDAQLDLAAVYRVRAPLYDIMFEKNEAYRRRVPVDVTMHLREKLMNPEIRFEVRLPTVDESVRTQVNSVLSTEQELNRQVFALIVLNRFVPPPAYTGQAAAGGNVAGTTTSELLSNQVSNWLSRLSSDFDLGVNYRPGDNITQDELELAVSTQLFDERLLLSTNVGVQYGAQAAQNSNALVGDFQLEYLLTDDGKLRMKAFSVSNDRNLNRADQALTTQGAGVAYREEFDTVGELWQKFLNIFRGEGKDRKFD